MCELLQPFTHLPLQRSDSLHKQPCVLSSLCAFPPSRSLIVDYILYSWLCKQTWDRGQGEWADSHLLVLRNWLCDQQQYKSTESTFRLMAVTSSTVEMMENALVVFCFPQLHLNEKVTLLTSMSVYLRRNKQSVSQLLISVNDSLTKGIVEITISP